MIALLTFFLLLVGSLLITRISTVALILTGMSPHIARFQSRSALSGTGFTTSESEAVVNHPARRKIIGLLMLIGSAGLVTAVAAPSITFVGQDAASSTGRLALLVIGAVVVLLIARNKAADRAMGRFFAAVPTRFSDLALRDYDALFHLSDGYSVREVPVAEDDWMCSRTLGDLQLRREGLAVLGVERSGGSYIGAPYSGTAIHPGDTLILYGLHDAITEIGARKRDADGDRAHDEAARALSAARRLRMTSRSAGTRRPPAADHLRQNVLYAQGFFMGRTGIEPVTLGLRVPCSTS